MSTERTERRSLIHVHVISCPYSCVSDRLYTCTVVYDVFCQIAKATGTILVGLAAVANRRLCSD